MTPAATTEAEDRIRLHPCCLPARTTWWASVDGRYLRTDYPTPEAARAAAQAHLGTAGAGDRKDTTS